MNRFWVASGDLLYPSDAFSDDYSLAFDRTTSAFRFASGGEIKSIYPVYLNGQNMMLVFKRSSSWLLNINATDITASRVEPLDLTKGCVGRNAVTQVGDDVWFLSTDGVRSVVKSQLDRARGGSSNALTFLIKDDIDQLNWNYAQNAQAVYYQGMFLLAIPGVNSAKNNKILIGYPQYIIPLTEKDSYPSWSVMEGVNVARWGKYFVDGEERLYYGEGDDDGLVYRFWDEEQLNFNGSQIDFSVATKAIDFAYPQQFKYGGEIEVRTDNGDGTLLVEAEVDGAGWATLGEINLQRNLISLPISGLPFDLDTPTPISEKFHLDSLGKFRKLRVRVSTKEVDSDVRIYSISIASYLDEYMGE
jgi:hypothetical protein